MTIIMMLMLLLWAVVVPLVSFWAWRTLDWVWLTPRRIERELRRQGLGGNHYRILYGDAKDNVRLSKDVRSRPLPLYCHDIGPRVLPLFHKAIKDHGKTSFTWLGPFPRVTLMNPESVKEVLSNKFGHFMRPRTTPLAKFLVQGLLSHEGEKWAKHRRIINPAFHLEKLKLMYPAFSASCGELIRRWDKMIPDESCLELDVFPEIQNVTLDVISRTAFGSSYEEGRRIFELLTEQTRLVIPAAQNVYIPGYRFLPTPMNQKRSQVDKEMKRILRDMIEKRERAMRKGESSKKNDLLGILLESNMKEAEEVQGKKSKNRGMTTEDVIEECKLFYLAGQETTAVLLTWTMILLGMYPNWQAKAREEVLHVFGKNTPDMDGLSRLKIVTMILYEVLRLYPPGSWLLREVRKPTEVGGITYPPGVTLLLPILLIHHDTEFWGEDAKEFKPERFAEGISKASKVAGAFFPFGGGPRICIGQNFALIEAKIGLSMILQHFSFELSPSYIHAPCLVFSVQPQHGAQLRLGKL
ncbi:cytochrome P450 CYP72A219-like [Dioscorea cayenensis subsp. rotundata]|uniref:Cytochrome P450 CYP72A219-like n=1 Tax=Dioscorea cayennensis subsp. rotundata TaxID=55577 RepID=A0AB40AY28_DIOCR|nr:cytochrome P450 CYP72A219-like [Dioscorea cayenensis subsp. rotundata]